MKNPQTTESIAVLGVAALLTTEIAARINQGETEQQTINGTAVSEAMQHNLAQTVFRKELMAAQAQS